MRKNLTSQHLTMILQARGIIVKDDQKNIDKLLNFYRQNPEGHHLENYANSLSTSTRSEILNVLKQLNQLDCKISDRFYTEKDHLAKALQNHRKATDELFDRNRNKVNVFEAYHKQITYFEESPEISEIILLVISSSEIIEINAKNGANLVQLKFVPRKLQKNVYSYSFLDQDFLKKFSQWSFSLEIKVISSIIKNHFILIQNPRMFLKSFHRAGLIIIDYSQSQNFYQVRTKGVLYSIAALSQRRKIEKHQNSRSLDYEWMTLFFNELFTDKISMDTVAGFSIPKMEQKSIYKISRIYVFILHQFSKIRQKKSVKQFLDSDFELLRNLKFPILTQDKYNFSDNLKELEQIYIQFCLKYSLKIDKKVQFNADICRVAIQNLQDYDLVNILKQISENRTQIFAYFDETQLIKITRNQFITSKTAIWILCIMIFKKRQIFKDLKTDQLVVNFLVQIVCNISERDNVKDMWNKQVSLQDFARLMNENQSFLIKDEQMFTKFYKILKQLSIIQKDIFNTMMRIVKPHILNIFNKRIFSPQILQCFTLKPRQFEDEQIIASCYFREFDPIKKFDAVIRKRFRQPELFDTQSFDVSLYKFVQFQYRCHRNSYFIEELANIFDGVISICQNQNQDIQFGRKNNNEGNPLKLFKKIIDSLNLNDIPYIKDKIIGLIQSAVKMKNLLISETLLVMVQLFVSKENIKLSEDQFKFSFLKISREQNFRQNQSYYNEIINSMMEQPKNQQQVIRQYWQILLKQNCGWNLVNKKARKLGQFKIIMNKISEKIQSDDLYIEDLLKLHCNRQDLIENQKKLQGNFHKLIDQCFKKYQIFKERLTNAKQVLSTIGKLEFELKQVNTIQEQMKQMKLNQCYKLKNCSPILNQLFQTSTDIKELLIPSPFFKKNQLSGIKQTINQLHETKKTLRIQFSKIFNENCSYQQFLETTKVSNIQKWCRAVFDKNEQSTKVIYILQMIKRQRLDNINKIVISYKKLKYQIEKVVQTNFQPFCMMYQRLQENQKISTKQIISQTQRVCKRIMQDFSLKSQKQIFSDQVIIIIQQTINYGQMFKKIDQGEVDSQVIMNLKELVMNQIYGNLKRENIQQFQIVWVYWNELKKFKKMDEFVTKIRSEINQRMIKLSENILNTYHLHDEILEKIKQIENKQASFREQIELILKQQSQTIFLIQQANTPNFDLKFNLQVKPRKKLYNSLEESIQIKRISMKQMEEYKQACLIFKSEVQSRKQYQNISRSFSDFLRLFQRLQIIKNNCIQLIQYGYNPKRITKTIKLHPQQLGDGKNCLVTQIDSLEVQLKQWRSKVKKSYESSFLFTFYMGKGIKTLIQQIVQQKYPIKVKNTCDVSQEEYKQIFKQEKYSKIPTLKENEKLQNAVGILVQLQRQSGKLNQQAQKKMKRNKITLNFTDQSNYIYQFNSSQDLPKIYEIFFCLQETTLGEIQVFLNRAFKRNRSIYYIIGAHFLKEQIKNDFFQLIKSIYHKESRKGIQLKFIDCKSTDILYSHLRWCSDLDVHEIRQQKIHQNVKQNALAIENMLKDTKLVTSSRPGLGKTYYVQKYAITNNQQLIYFPICGNIDFTSIMKRLKELNTQNRILLIQIGYIEKSKHQKQSMGNMEKLQIFLTMIILMKAFSHNGEFVYLSNISAVFIQIENLMQNTKHVNEQQQNSKILLESKGLIQLLRQKKKEQYISEFKSSNIEFDPQNFRELFTLKYLELYDRDLINNTNLICLKASDVSKLQELIKQNNFFYSEIEIKEDYVKQKIIGKGLEDSLYHFRFIIDVIVKLSKVKKYIQKLNSLSKQKEQHEQLMEKNTSQIFQNKPKMPWQIQMELDKLRKNSLIPSYPQNKVSLVHRYFVSKLKTPSFRSYKLFISILFQKVKVFSLAHNLSVQEVQYYKTDYYLKKTELSKIRKNFFQVLLDNTVQILIETNISQVEKRKREFYQSLKSSPTIILNSNDYFGYQFVYRRVEKVQISIKSLIASQNITYFNKVRQIGYNFTKIRQDIADIFNQDAYDRLTPQKQQKKMMEAFFNLSGKLKFNKDNLTDIYKQVKGLGQYKLTLDNFYKICYIIQKANSLAPIIIMGESGVGKTALIKFTVNQIFEEKLLVFNVHAGIHLPQLEKWVNQIIYSAVKKPKQRLWVFFDEFNTSEELSYIKQIVIDRRFLGILLPKNIIFCTACNPYRMRQNTNINSRAFNVKAPNLSMVSLMWDYEQLRKQQCESYCYKILKEIPFKVKQIVTSIINIHNLIHESYQLSYASLRDVARFKQLYCWFQKSIPKQPLQINDEEYSKENYQLRRQQRAMILAFCFVYSLKFSRNRERQQILQIVEKQFAYKKRFMNQVLIREQIEYVIRLKDPTMKIAYNRALRQNLFTSLVCILNKIPILLIGPPGSSKSLSIKLINSNLRGKFSKNEFCRQFPQFMFHYFQGSESSTSQGILKPFAFASKPKPQGTQYLIVFDELGIAEKSIHNPTKVLNSKLQDDSKLVSVICVSNTELDCSKMSRLLTIKRQQPQLEQLKDTAVKIYQSFMTHDNGGKKLLEDFTEYYQKFRLHYEGKLKNYYGQRDFYSALRYICNKLSSESKQNRDIIISEAIRINYDAHRETDTDVSSWYKAFLEFANVNFVASYPSIESVITQNISYQDSRYLLFVVKEDSIIQNIIQSKVEVHNKRKQIKCIYCSPFSKDNQQESYNVQFTSNIISEMSKGTILAIKDLTNSVQTSLYDLFNKAYVSIGKKNYCRIAVGATSNPKCYVNSEFSIIIFVSQQFLQNTQAAFLNRFQKHFITIIDELTSTQKNLLKIIQQWLKQIEKLWQKFKLKNKQSYLINTNQYALASLVIKYRDIMNQQQRVQKIKEKILQNATNDFDILVNKILTEETPNVNKIILEKVKILRNKLKIPLSHSQKSLIRISISQFQQDQIYNPFKFQKDMIIFTYSSMQDMKQINKQFPLNKLKQIGYIKVNETQKALKHQLEKAFNNDQIKIIQINLHYEKDNKIINYILFLTKNIKKDLKSQKQIRVIIELNRSSIYQNRKSLKGKVNISHLFDFQQCFYDHIAQSILSFGDQSQLFEYLYTDSKITDLYAQSILNINFEVRQSKFSSKYYIEFLLNLLNDKQFMLHVRKIIVTILKQQQIKFKQILPLKSAQIPNKMIFNNMKELFTNYLKEKIIIILKLFIQSLCKGNKLLLLASKKEKETHYIHQDLKNKQFKQSYERQIGQYSNIKIQLLKNVCLQLQAIFFSNEQQKKEEIRIILENQICYIYPNTIDIIQCMFGANQKLSFDNLEIQAVKLFNIDEDSQENQQCSMTKIDECQQKVTSLIQAFKLQFLKIKIEVRRAQIFLQLNDIIKYYLQINDLKEEKSAIITDLCLHAAQPNSNLLQLVLVLCFNRDYWKNIFQIIISLQDSYPVQRIKQTISKHTSHEDVRQLTFKSRMLNVLHSIVNPIFQTGLELIKISSYNFVKEKFVKLEKIIYQKVLSLSLQSKGLKFKRQLKISPINLTEDKLIDLFERLPADSAKLLEEYINFEANNSFSYLKIIKFCQKLLSSHKESESENQIVRFLACSLYWSYSRLDESNKQLKIKDRKTIIQFCCIFAQNYPLFANLLIIKYFPQIFYDYFEEEQEQLQVSGILTNDIQRIYEKLKQINPTQTIGQISVLTQNFKIALSLYFRSVISQKMENNNSAQSYESQHRILQNFADTQQLIQKRLVHNANNLIVQLYSYEFLKLYYEKYVTIIIFDKSRSSEQSNIIQSIGKYFKNSIQDQLGKHLNLYLLKFMYHHPKIQDKALLVQTLTKKAKSYPQLQGWVSFLNNNKNQYNYQQPLNIFDRKQLVFDLFIKTKQSNFNPNQFKKMIKQSLKTQKNTYQLLTVFSTFIYAAGNSQIKESLLQSMQKYLNQIEQLSLKQNIIIKILLQCYLRKKITRLFFFRSQNFKNFTQSLPLLNFLNLICAYRKNNCCFIQMFFDNGKVIEKFAQWGQGKYIFGTLNNPQLLRCMHLMSTQSRRYKYYICSKQCSYIKQISAQNQENYFSFKGSNIFSSQVCEQNCPFCLKNQPDSTKVTTPSKIFETLVQKRQFTDPLEQEKFQLTGYRMGRNVKDVQKYLRLISKYDIVEIYGQNPKNILITKKVLQMVQFFIWHIFSELKLAQLIPFVQKKDELKSIYEYFKREIERSLQGAVEQKDLNSWYYAFAQLIEQTIMESNNQQISNLRSPVAKINFQFSLMKKYAKYLGLQKEKTIKMNKFYRFPTNINLLEQAGILEEHEFQYKKIRLFKYVENGSIQQQRLLSQFKNLQNLAHSYEPLYYLLQKLQTRIEVEARLMKQIYSFIYKIWEQFNFQHKREEANTPMKDLISNLSNKLQKEKLLQQLENFYENWNQIIDLVQDKKYHQYKYKGQQFPLSRFILDSKQKKTGLMVNFIDLTSKSYNRTCLQIEEKIKRHYSMHENIRIFSSLKMNPTLIGQKQTFWKLSSQWVKERINDNKYNSIIYGISKEEFQYNQIQYLIVKRLHSSHYLISNRNQFKYFYFVDDDTEIQQALKATLNQGLSEIEKQQIKSELKSNKSNQQQYLKTVIHSVKRIISYLKYFTDNLDITIAQFIRRQRQIHQNTIKISHLQDQEDEKIQNSQIKVHPLQNLDKKLEKDVFSKLRLKKMINLLKFLNDLEEQINENPKKKPESPSKVEQKKPKKQNKKKDDY